MADELYLALAETRHCDECGLEFEFMTVLVGQGLSPREKMRLFHGKRHGHAYLGLSRGDTFGDRTKVPAIEHPECQPIFAMHLLREDRDPAVDVLIYFANHVIIEKESTKGGNHGSGADVSERKQK